MPEPEGALRDRLILDAFRTHVKQALTTIGWFEPIGPPGARLDPIVWLDERVPDDAVIQPNTMAISTEDHDVEDLELGSNASEDSIEVWIDFWATEEALGRDVQGDLIAILRGQRPAAGCDEPSYMVLDTDGLTELFTVEIAGVRGIHGHDPRTPADRFWFATVCYVVDERP